MRIFQVHQQSTVLNTKAPLWHLPNQSRIALARCWPGSVGHRSPEEAWKEPPREKAPAVGWPAAYDGGSRRQAAAVKEETMSHARAVYLVDPSTDIIIPTYSACEGNEDCRYDPEVIASCKPDNQELRHLLHQSSTSVNGSDKIVENHTPDDKQPYKHNINYYNDEAWSVQRAGTCVLKVSMRPRADVKKPKRMSDESMKDALQSIKEDLQSATWKHVAAKVVSGKVGKKGAEPVVHTSRISASPHKVYFMKPCIKPRFSCGKSLSKTIEDLKSGNRSVEDIPLITVIQRHGKLISVDHRRLYCFRAAFPQDVEIPMLLAHSSVSEARLNKYVAADCKYYSAVRVEKEKDDVPQKELAQKKGSTQKEISMSLSCQKKDMTKMGKAESKYSTV